MEKSEEPRDQSKEGVNEKNWVKVMVGYASSIVLAVWGTYQVAISNLNDEKDARRQDQIRFKIETDSLRDAIISIRVVGIEEKDAIIRRFEARDSAGRVYANEAKKDIENLKQKSSRNNKASRNLKKEVTNSNP